MFPESRLSFFIILFCLLPWLPTAAQFPSRFIKYDVKDGLSQNSVHALLRDSDGIMWIGTQDGLNSFNGKNFTTYRHSDHDLTTISDQFILRIKEDLKGNLWIGTRNGLNYYNKRTQKFSRYYVSGNHPHVFQAGYDQFVVMDDNRLAICKEGLFLLDPETGRMQQYIFPGYENVTWLITPGYQAWAILENERMYASADLRNKPFSYRGRADFYDSTDLRPITNFYPARGMLYLLSQDKHDLLQFHPVDGSIKGRIHLPETINDVHVVSDAEIYLATGSGLATAGVDKSPQWLSHTGNSDGVPAGAILTSYKDERGNIWLGSAGSGIAVSNVSFNNFRLLKPAAGDLRVKCIATTNDKIYAGTNNGIFTSDIGDTSRQQMQAFLTGKNICGIAVDALGQIWAAEQDKGISIFSPAGKIQQQISLKDSLSDHQVLRMYADNRGNVFVCTTHGLHVFSKAENKPVHFESSDSLQKLTGDYVMDAYRDDNNHLWVASNNGLDVFTPEYARKQSFRSEDDRNSFLARTIITSVTQDWQGAIWIGTIRNGVYRYLNGSYKHYNHNSGLSSDVVYNVVCDNERRIWASTSAGLNIFVKNENAFRTLTPFDGVPNTSYSFGAVARQNNQLFFGTSDGLLICNTANLTLNKINFKAYISDIRVNGNSYAAEGNKMTIQPDNKLIVFHLATSPAFYSRDIIFQYRLKGQSEEWTTLGPGIRTVSYTGLPYQENLVMQVRAAGSINNLSDAPIYELAITSKPPFWKTSFFILLIILAAAVALFWTILRYNKKRYQRNLQAMQVEKELQKERVRIGRDLHDNIGAYTSALIAGLNRIQPVDARQEKDVANLKDYGSSIMGLLRETIWMLNAQHLVVTAFADRFINYAQRINKNYPQIDFVFHEDITVDKELQPATMLNLFRILQEALQNACKHAQASEIEISISSGNSLCFTVRDNGKGFSTTPGEGHYGISNIRERAAEAGFQVVFDSGPEGTTITIRENTANAALADLTQTN